MAATDSPEADQIAELVRIGAKLGAIDACDELQADPACSDWHLVVGQGGQIPGEVLPLLCQAAQNHPSWVDPGALDLSHPLAVQLLELALSVREVSEEQEQDRLSTLNGRPSRRFL